MRVSWESHGNLYVAYGIIEVVAFCNWGFTLKHGVFPSCSWIFSCKVLQRATHGASIELQLLIKGVKEDIHVGTKVRSCAHWMLPQGMEVLNPISRIKTKNQGGSGTIPCDHGSPRISWAFELVPKIKGGGFPPLSKALFWSVCWEKQNATANALNPAEGGDKGAKQLW